MVMDISEALESSLERATTMAVGTLCVPLRTEPRPPGPDQLAVLCEVEPRVKLRSPLPNLWSQSERVAPGVFTRVFNRIL